LIHLSHSRNYSFLIHSPFLPPNSSCEQLTSFPSHFPPLVSRCPIPFAPSLFFPSGARSRWQTLECRTLPLGVPSFHPSHFIRILPVCSFAVEMPRSSLKPFIPLSIYSASYTFLSVFVDRSLNFLPPFPGGREVCRYSLPPRGQWRPALYIHQRPITLIRLYPNKVFHFSLPSAILHCTLMVLTRSSFGAFVGDNFILNPLLYWLLSPILFFSSPLSSVFRDL